MEIRVLTKDMDVSGCSCLLSFFFFFICVCVLFLVGLFKLYFFLSDRDVEVSLIFYYVERDGRTMMHAMMVGLYFIEISRNFIDLFLPSNSSDFILNYFGTNVDLLGGQK